MRTKKSGPSGVAAPMRRPAKPRGAVPATSAEPGAAAVAHRVRPEEWRGTKRNASINAAIVAKFKVLSGRGKSLTQIADKLGISLGRAKNISAEIRLGKK